MLPLSNKQFTNKLDVDSCRVLRIYHKAVTFISQWILSKISDTGGSDVLFRY